MESLLSFVHHTPSIGVVALLVVAVLILGKAADVLVEAAIHLSKSLGIPTIIIGATILSLGTTTPEAVVSVLAAFRGNPELALGNAVGSIICDTGLILGLVCVIGPLRVDRKSIEWSAWIQIISAGALVLLCLPWANLSTVFTIGGGLPRWGGYLFLAGLVLYMVLTIVRAKKSGAELILDEVNGQDASNWAVLFKLFICLFFVIISSEVLIHAATELAKRASIPDSVIAATLVAFGTSLPELVTAITALRKGQSELAVGNIIGADILNVLFVAGAAASVTPAGLTAPPHFFTIVFPSMIGILACFRIALYFSKPIMPRVFGAILLGLYVLVTLLSFTLT